MILLQTQNLARHFSGDYLFQDVNIEIKSKDRLALVGRNGAGKSTLLKMIAGIEEPDEGRIIKGKQVTIGYLAQRTGIISDKTIMEEMLTVFEDLIQMEEDMARLEEEMSRPDLQDKPEDYQAVLSRYDQLQTYYQQNSGFTYENEIRAVLNGFHFYQEDYDKPITDLSGGQKTRLALAKLLLEDHDLLILDEPTNHLDIETLEWLENYLKGYRGALLIVSHDRYFLDQIVNQVYELEHGQANHFLGNYSDYLDQKAALIERQWKEYTKQQKEIAEMEDFVNRNLVRASTTKRAQSRRKQLEKMDRLDKPKGKEKSAHFNFTPKQSSGEVVLTIRDLYIGYAGQKIAGPINLDLKKGEAIAIVGPNGVGKSTLLKTITGELQALQGDIKLGSKVDLGYYDQEQLHLNQRKDVLHEVWDDHPSRLEGDIRQLLGSFLFSGSDVEKTIASLSGGEKARVALAKLSLNQDNTLILDEPTNHLDIDSKEVLENALLDFDGSILFVSHDRYFINRIADKVIEILPEGSTTYLGDYDYYIEKKAELAEIERLTENPEKNPADKKEADEKNLSENALDRESQKERQKTVRRLGREIASLEDSMEEMEDRMTKIEAELIKPEVYQDPKKAKELADELDKLKQENNQALEEWEDKALELEGYQENNW